MAVSHKALCGVPKAQQLASSLGERESTLLEKIPANCFDP